MYKLIIVNNKFKLFGKKEEIKIFYNKDDLLKAIDEIGGKTYYIKNEKDEIVDINDLIDNRPKEEVYSKSLEINYNDINIKILLTENKFNHDIKSKLSVNDIEKLYMNCMIEHKLFGKLELYDYFKNYLKELKDLDLAYMIMDLIFNQ